MFRVHDNIAFCLLQDQVTPVSYQELDWLPHIFWIISVIIVIIIEKPLSMQLVKILDTLSHIRSQYLRTCWGILTVPIESEVSPQCFQFKPPILLDFSSILLQWPTTAFSLPH